jgi:pyruvate formate lyase activating enzyme
MNNVDLFLYDLKIIDLEKHRKYTGVPNDRVLKNLYFLAGRGKHVTIRFPVIPGITDTGENVVAVRDLLLELPVLEQIDLLPYHRIAKNKYQRLNIQYKLEDLEEPSVERMNQLKSTFEQAGMKVSVGG